MRSRNTISDLNVKHLNSVLDRLISNSKKVGDCIEWQLRTDDYGYGGMWCLSGEVLVHRLSYMLFIGDIPDGLCVLHSCDNRKCVRPLHLWIGTSQENTEDARKKGRLAIGFRNGKYTMPHRTPRGELSGHSKLKEKDVLKIRELACSGLITHTELAKMFRVSKSLIGPIIHRHIWTHI